MNSPCEKCQTAVSESFRFQRNVDPSRISTFIAPDGEMFFSRLRCEVCLPDGCDKCTTVRTSIEKYNPYDGKKTKKDIDILKTMISVYAGSLGVELFFRPDFGSPIGSVIEIYFCRQCSDLSNELYHGDKRFSTLHSSKGCSKCVKGTGGTGGIVGPIGKVDAPNGTVGPIGRVSKKRRLTETNECEHVTIDSNECEHVVIDVKPELIYSDDDYDYY